MNYLILNLGYYISTTQLAILKAWSLNCVDTNNTETLASWRQPTNPESQYFAHADWPIPIDLSYTNSDLLTAGLNGFPVGDNWFPSQYASWKAQESADLANINNVLTAGVTAVEKAPGVPSNSNCSKIIRIRSIQRRRSSINSQLQVM